MAPGGKSRPAQQKLDQGGQRQEPGKAQGEGQVDHTGCCAMSKEGANTSGLWMTENSMWQLTEDWLPYFTDKLRHKKVVRDHAAGK